MRLLSLIFFTIFILNIRDVRCDDYTSIFKLTNNLLKAELYYTTNFEAYLKQMEYKTKEINKSLALMEKLAHEIAFDRQGHDNPLNAFKMLTRFAIDWEQMRRVVLDNKLQLTYLTNIDNFPTAENIKPLTILDLYGASRGLERMQSFFQLNAHDMASGNLMKIVSSSPFTASDCFHLGESLLKVGEDHKYAAEWLMEARIRLVDEVKANASTWPAVTYGFPYVTDVQILAELITAMSLVGNSNLAQVFNDELLAQEPNNTEALKNKELFANQTREERRIVLIEDAESPTVDINIFDIDILFEKTCRGEEQQTPREKRDLRCRYVHNNVPFCFIAPFKKEELNFDPEVAYYHQVMYDHEIESIIHRAKGHVNRSRVGHTDPDSFYTELRISQGITLKINKNDSYINFIQRMIDITGLTLNSEDNLQVTNYGVGGYYTVHYDFLQDPKDTYKGHSDRILTALFYMSNVELGGGTAFPFIPLLVEPIKGSMLVWYNMHKSLEVDKRTLHGACPVVIGSKWISTQWFKSKGQEFIRPCDFQPDGYKSIEYNIF